MDGRQGRRLGRHAAPRQGGRDQRALVQRAAACSTAGRASTAAATGSIWPAHAARARESFNARFWYAEGGYLYDVVDGEQGDDPACRPNQVFAISLDHPVLDESRWAPVMEVVRSRLLTPVGLRSLAPGHPDYKAKYYGDLRSRDAAYHQGTVWAWLIGPFVDAWLKLHPEDRAGRARSCSTASKPTWTRPASARSARSSTPTAPYTPRGCVAQAWSVAEVLRVLEKTRARLNAGRTGRQASMPSPRLTSAGTTASRDAFAPHAAEGLVAGARQPRAHAHLPRARPTAASGWRACRAGCVTRPASRAEFPAVGDWVAVEPPGRRRRWRASASVLPRASRFSRRAAGDRTEEQVVAANIDVVFLVVGLDGDFNPRRIERYLLVASDSGATPVVVLNKADLVDRSGAATSRRCRRCSPGVAVHAVSCDAPGVAGGAARPSRRRPHRSAARVVRRRQVDHRQPAGRLRPAGDARRARSPTAAAATPAPAVSWCCCPGQGILIDTPGMRELQLWETGDAAAGTFADIAALAAGCRFRDCAHESEPGCAVVRGGRSAASCRPPARELPQAAARAGAPASPAGPARAARREAPRERPCDAQALRRKRLALKDQGSATAHGRPTSTRPRARHHVAGSVRRDPSATRRESSMNRRRAAA